MKEPLRAQIERAAKKNGVSMNAEINSRLEQSFAEQNMKESLREILRETAVPPPLNS